MNLYTCPHGVRVRWSECCPKCVGDPEWDRDAHSALLHARRQEDALVLACSIDDRPDYRVPDKFGWDDDDCLDFERAYERECYGRSA